MLILSLVVPLLACSINISGVVFDDETNEPIPFVNIWIPGTTIGTTSNIDGEFTLQTDSYATISFSSVGYVTQSKQVDLKSIDYLWEIRLKKNIQNIAEISVKPDNSYDEALFKKVLDHKKENSKDLTLFKKFSNYDRTTVLLATNKNGKLQKFLKVPDSVLINEENGASYLPVYYSESLKNITQNNDTEVDIVSDRKDGILPNLNKQIESIVLKKIVVDFNFYKNQITVLDRGFISPLSNMALLYYNIYVTDSLFCDGTKHYKFSFYPKNKHDVVFNGHFWVEDSSFALISISATLPSKANINFINELSVNVTYEKQSNGKWFYKDQKTDAKFSLGKSTSLDVSDDQYDKKDEQGGEFQVNRFLQYKLQSPKDTVENQNNIASKSPFLISFSEIEQQTKDGIQKLKENKVIKRVDKIGDMFLSGYYTQGKFEIGPIFDIYSTNKIEGNRFTLPIRTSEALFKNYTVGGYMGFGTKNNKVKYGISAAFRLPSKTRTILSAQYSDDYAIASKSQYTQFIQENPYSKGSDNFIPALTSKERNAFVYHQKRFEMKLETDLSKCVGLSVNPYYNRNYSSDYLKFNVNKVDIGSFDNTGMLINLRFAFDQHYDETYFARVYYGNTKPVLNVSFDVGKIRKLPGNTSSKNFYALSNVSVKHRFNLGQAYLRYMVNAGYMIGNVPYTLLDKPYGNNSLGYSRYSFNLLNYASFAHNLYTNIHLNLNGGGTLFNRMPLLSSFNLREIVSLKCHYGTRTKQLRNTIDIPDFYNQKQTKPYFELGFGVTNIFKVLRVEYVRVLGNKEAINNYAIKHGIRMRFEVIF
jgi:hypothetical protein